MTRTILVADDSSTIQKVIKIAFARFAVDIIEAGSYIESLAAVGRATPDALIIDASLPGARGPADFAKLSSDSQRAPLLLLIGTYEAVDEAAFRQAGFQHFLKKPFESSDIVHAVDRLLGGRLRQASGAQGDAEAGSPAEALAKAGPIVPPLPGSGNRQQHTTVFHPGGFGAMRDSRSSMPPPPPGVSGYSGLAASQGPEVGPLLGDFDDLPPGPGAMPPPPPMVDEARRGRRAFGEGHTATNPYGAGVSTIPPPPPLSLSLDDEDFNDSLPPPPSSRSTMPPAAPPRFAAGLGAAEDTGPGMTSDQDEPDYAPPAAAPRRHPDAPALAGLEGDLPALVRQAVEDYCERHFKSLAREIIASELRRLADEKARHLVDN